MIRIRSELVKYFLLLCGSVGVSLECNFLLYTADPHIVIIEEEASIDGVSLWRACDDGRSRALGLLSHADGHSC